MGNGPTAENWGRWLRRVADRPGWSVARLARESNFNPATIFEWIRHEDGDYVKVGDVVAIARGAGEDPLGALRAAAGLAIDVEEDPEIANILAMNLRPEIKARVIETILARRTRDQERRMQDTTEFLRSVAEGQTNS